VGPDYIEIPVLVKFTLPSTGRFQPYFLGGPAIAFNVGNETKVEIETFKQDVKIFHFDDYFDKIDNVKGTIFEAIFAGGIEMKFGKNRLLFEGRYTRSFGDTFEDVADIDAIPEGEVVIANDPSGKALDVQHSDFSILVGYSFGFDF
jgi:hypothetical protein